MEGKTKSVPVRFTGENDAYLSEVMKSRGYNNRNLTVNIILEEHRIMIGEYRERAKNKALKLLHDFHIKPKELE